MAPIPPRNATPHNCHHRPQKPVLCQKSSKIILEASLMVPIPPEPQPHLASYPRNKDGFCGHTLQMRFPWHITRQHGCCQLVIINIPDLKAMTWPFPLLFLSLTTIITSLTPLPALMWSWLDKDMTFYSFLGNLCKYIHHYWHIIPIHLPLSWSNEKPITTSLLLVQALVQINATKTETNTIPDNQAIMVQLPKD